MDKKLVLKFLILESSTWRNPLMVVAAVLAMTGAVTSVQADPTVDVTIDTTKPISAPAGTLCGISEELGSIMYGDTKQDPNGWLFSATNAELTQLFENAGIQSMRVGGDSADQDNPSTNDIDHFFGFVTNLDMPTVYTLNYLGGNETLDADYAQYIVNTYGQFVDQEGNFGSGPGPVMWFDIGNEPTLYTNEYNNITNWLPHWNSFANAVENRYQNTRVWLGGADETCGSNGTNDEMQFFAKEYKYVPYTNLITATLHFNPLTWVNNETEYDLARDSLTNMENGADYFPNMRDFMSNVITANVHSPSAPAAYYDFTEFNNLVTPPSSQNTNNVNDNTFAYGIFALDALNWWAANTLYWDNGCVGVHFHAGGDGFHSAWWTEGSGASITYYAYPLMYAMAAYTICDPGTGNHGEGIGKCEPVTVQNNEHINVTAYAIGHEDPSSGSCTNLFVTFINKTEDSWKTNVTVNIMPAGMTSGDVYAMYFVAKNGSSTEETNVTLGGAALNGQEPFQPAWTYVGLLSGGVFTTTVTNLTAAIFRIGD